MARPGKKTFVGFGFGPIQSGLFLYEAYASGHFGRFVVAEVDGALVQAVRDNGGAYTVNIARKDRVDQVRLSGIELLNPRVADDRTKLVAAVAESDEMATALPKVDYYISDDETNVVAILADGLARRRESFPTVIYAAENHNHAAEILTGHLASRPAGGKLRDVQVLNTVIGKMSGVITDAETIRRMKLTTITPAIPRAILVEEFNRILVSKITLGGFSRGIDCFLEKPDLLPFEEAKLYGHNAIHALIGYLADFRGLTTIAQAAGRCDIMGAARRAFIDESGATLIRRHKDLGDPLFTADGYRAYADDLLERMVNPNLNDLVARVGRDHVRKLGYDDRLYGTMHLALRYGVEPTTLALGAAAGILSLIKRQGELEKPVPELPQSVAALDREALRRFLLALWGDKADAYAERLIDLTWRARQRLGANGAIR